MRKIYFYAPKGKFSLDLTLRFVKAHNPFYQVESMNVDIVRN